MYKGIYFIYIIQAHWRVPPTTDVVELWQKLFCNEHQRKWVVFLEKWMNILNIFTGDLYYMYAILQGIGSLSCIRVIIYYIRNFLWGSSNPGCLKFLKRFNKKNRSPEMIIFFFNIVLKKWVSEAQRRGPPTTGVVELWENNMLQWTPTELGGVPGKMDEYVHWGRIFYVCNSARNWVPFMYKGIYYIRNSLWGAATLDVWSS